MLINSPIQFDNVSVICKANVYFDGKVVSHTIIGSDQSRKTIGIIFPGLYNFNTGGPERMEIIAGACRARIAGENDWRDYSAGNYFDVPGQSNFEIEVLSGIAEYICSFV